MIIMIIVIMIMDLVDCNLDSYNTIIMMMIIILLVMIIYNDNGDRVYET